jgi:hypothetical protein
MSEPKAKDIHVQKEDTNSKHYALQHFTKTFAPQGAIHKEPVIKLLSDQDFRR